MPCPHTRGQILCLITDRTAKGGRSLLPRPGLRHFTSSSRGDASRVQRQRGATEELSHLWEEWVLHIGFPIPFVKGLQLLNYYYKNGSCDPLRSPQEVRPPIGATFRKGAQSRQAMETLTLQIQKSREGSQANTRPRANVLSKITWVKWKLDVKSKC